MQQVKTLLLHELEAFVTNENVVARKESVSENQRCDPQSRNEIIEPTVKSDTQPPETMNHIPFFTKLPVIDFNEQPMKSCNVLEPYKVIRNHLEWHDVLDNNHTELTQFMLS
jgi:hypothetical protein